MNHQKSGREKKTSLGELVESINFSPKKVRF